MWEATAILAGTAAVFGIGWLLGRLGRPSPETRRPPTEIRVIGFDQADVRQLEDILGTENVDPQSWGALKFGPLTDGELAQIAGRFQENKLTTADAARLIFELKRIRLKDGSS